MVQARPEALVYWNSEPKLKFDEQHLIVTTGLTFSTVSKVMVVSGVMLVVQRIVTWQCKDTQNAVTG